jgi:hypothetical protein
MTETVPAVPTVEEVAQAAASRVRLTVDASLYTVQELEFIANHTTQKTYVDIVNSNGLSQDDQAAITRSAAGQLTFS